MGNLRKIRARRKSIWVETECGMIPSEEAAEKLMEVVKPSEEEIKMREEIVNRHVEAGLWIKGKDGHYYLTEKAMSRIRLGN